MGKKTQLMILVGIFLAGMMYLIVAMQPPEF